MDPERLNRLEELYKEIPRLRCKGKCQEACGPIGLFPIEIASFKEKGIPLPVVGNHSVEGSLTCSHLKDNGRCAVYKDRPFICRLFGHLERLSCPYRCTSKKPFTQEDADRIISEIKALLDGESYYSLL